MNSFLSCFDCKAIRRQVVPVTGPIQRANEEDDSIQFGSFRNKPRKLQQSYQGKFKFAPSKDAPKSMRSRSAAPTNRAAVADILLFVEGINLQPDSRQNQHVVRDMCSMIRYEHDGFKVPNPLGNFLLKVIASESIFFDQDALNFLTISLEITTTFIERMRDMEEGFIQQEDPNFWIPLQGCLALTDIALMSALNFIEYYSNLLSDCFEDVLLGVDCLFVRFHALGPLLECESDSTIKTLFCQTMARACLVIQSVIERISIFEGSQANKISLRLVTLIQSLAPNMALCRQVCGEMSRDALILFWSECDSVVDCVLKMTPESTRLSLPSTEKRSLRMAGEYVTGPQQNAVGSLAMKLSSINKLRHALLLSIPTPQELFMEICRLKNANPRNSTVSFAYDGLDDDAETSQKWMDTYEAVEGEFCGLIFLRLKHALSGFQFLLKIGAVDAKDLKLNIPNIDDWVSSLAESLFLVLNTFSEGKSGLMSTQAFEFLVDLAPLLAESFFHVYVGSDIRSHYDWIFWELTKRMSNFVDSSKFDIRRCKSMRVSSTQRMVGPNSPARGTFGRYNSFDSGQDGLNNPVSSRTQEEDFGSQYYSTSASNSTTTGTVRKSSSTSNVKIINVSVVSMQPPKTEAVKSLTPHSTTTLPRLNHKPELPAIDLSPATGHGKMQLPSITPSKSIDSAAAGFIVGDLVDGLVQLSTGNERWFPGKIAAVNRDGSYDVEYDDGDVHTNKPSSEIRQSKKRQGKAALPQPSSSPPRATQLPTLAIKPSTPQVVPVVDAGYNIGARVDGLVQLSTGNERWFPGKIASVNRDGSYDVEYDDGDVHTNKPSSEIRTTKKKGVSSQLPTVSTPLRSVPINLADIKSPIEDILRPKEAAKSPVLCVTAFPVGTLIEGLVKLSSGVERWYPGKIAAVHKDGTADVVYNDGDVQKGKACSEIRELKKPRVVSGNAGCASHDSSPVKPSGQNDYTLAGGQSETGRSRGSNKGSNKGSARSGKESSRSNNSVIPFFMGDEIDGLVTLPNGSQRWFPGVITSVNLDGTYDIDYSDGDTQKCKRSSDIRETKRRGRSRVMQEIIVDDDISVGDKPVSIGAVGKTPSTRSLNHGSVGNRSVPEASPRSISSFNVVSTSPRPNNAGSTLGTVLERHAGGTSFTCDEGQEFNMDILDNNISITDNVLQVTDCDFDDDEDDDDGNFFEIPSVFANGLVRSELGGVVPGMSLSKVNFGSAGSYAAINQSLSTSLLFEERTDREDAESGNTVEETSAPFSAFGRVESFRSKGFLANRNFPTSDSYSKSRDNSADDLTRSVSNAGGIQRMMSWRERIDEQASGRSSIRSATSSIPLGTMASSLTAHAGVNIGGRGSSNSEVGDYSDHGREGDYHLPLDLLGKQDDVEFIIPDVLLRAYNVIVIILLRRCIIDRFFLDHACSSSRIVSNTSVMHFASSSTKAQPERHTLSGRSKISSAGSRPGSARSQGDSSTAPSGPAPLRHINLLFNMREYLEFIPPISDNFFYLAEVANTMGPNHSRVLKLLHSHFFQSCLPYHIETGEKIGEGGFGSIFKITCPTTCGEVAAKHRTLNPFKRVGMDATVKTLESLPSWKRCNCKSSVHVKGDFCPESVPSTSNSLGGIRYAVKRIPREKSVHDNQVLSAIFNEVSSLAALEGMVGVCQLIDYGVYLSEYWLVMELCGPNLIEWRRRNIDETTMSPYKRASGKVPVQHNELMLAEPEFSRDVLSVADAAMCLCIFVDILYIVKSVHDADVGHFDIKCNNVVLKLDGSGQHAQPVTSRTMNASQEWEYTSCLLPQSPPLTDCKLIREAHRKRKPSGQVVLIDFGESMPHMSAPKSRATIASTSAKCRGTLCVQSPEILCISSSNGGTRGPNQPKFPLPNKSSDIWSLGCLLVELLSGQYLFAERQWADLYVTLCRNKFGPDTIPLGLLNQSLSELPSEVQKAVETLLLSAMQQMPSERSSIDQLIRMVDTILTHNVFAGILGLPTTERSSKGSPRKVPQDNLKYKIADLSGASVEVLRAASNQVVHLGESLITLSDCVMLRIESTPPHPIALCTTYALQPTMEVDSRRSSEKPSLLSTKLESDKQANVEINLLARFEIIDKVISSSNLSRVVKDVGTRVVSSWSLQNNLLQILIVDSFEAKIALYSVIRKYGIEDKVVLIMLSDKNMDDALPSISAAFNRACRAICANQRVLITVNPVDDDDSQSSKGPTLPSFSKLTVSIATAIADGLYLWSREGSWGRKKSGDMMMKTMRSDEVTTSNGVSNYAPDVESACCRRVIDVVLEAIDRDAEYSLTYATSATSSQPIHHPRI